MTQVVSDTTRKCSHTTRSRGSTGPGVPSVARHARPRDQHDRAQRERAEHRARPRDLPERHALERDLHEEEARTPHHAHGEELHPGRETPRSASVRMPRRRPSRWCWCSPVERTPDHRRRSPFAGVLVRNPPEVGSRGTPVDDIRPCRRSPGGRCWRHDQPIRCRRPRRRPRRVRRGGPRRPARPQHRRHRGEVLGRCVPQRRAASPRRRCCATPSSRTSSPPGRAVRHLGRGELRLRRRVRPQPQGRRRPRQGRPLPDEEEQDHRVRRPRHVHRRRTPSTSRKADGVDRDGHLRQRDHRHRLDRSGCCPASQLSGNVVTYEEQILDARPAASRSSSSAPARSAWSSRYVLRNYGVEVTIIEFLDRALPNEDADVSKEITKPVQEARRRRS